MKTIKNMAGLQAEIEAARQRVTRASEAQQKLLDSLPLRLAGMAGLWALLGIAKRTTTPKAQPDTEAHKSASLKDRLLAAGQETAWFAIEKLITALLKK
jgi:hypothetical protein